MARRALDLQTSRSRIFMEMHKKVLFEVKSFNYFLAIIFAFFLMANFIFVICPKPAEAQEHGEINGRVVDASTGEPLPGANVQIPGSSIGTTANTSGMFALKNLPPATYTLRVSYIGYQTRGAMVTVSANAVARVDFALEPETIEMAQVVVTASREPEEIQNAVVSVSALTNDAAMRRNTLRLDAALESIPGVNLIGENLNVRNSTGYTRGLGSRVLVLLDGVPALTSDFGNMNWDLLPVTDFETVEVIKGPASALYGSFALGGVINVITKPPHPDGRLSLRTSAGIYDEPYAREWRWTGRTLTYNRADAGYSRQIGKLGVRFSLGRHESTGDRQNRHFQRWNGTGKLTWRFGNKSELSLFGAYSRDRRGEFIESQRGHPYLVPLEYLPYRIALDAYTFYLQYRLPANDWLELKWRLSYVRQLTGNHFRVNGDFQPAQGPGADWQIHARLDSSLSFTLGMEYHYDYAEQRDIGRHFAYTLSPYVQQIWQPGERLRVTAGLRFDHYFLLRGPKEQTHFPNRKPVINPFPDGKEEQYLSPQLGFSYQLASPTVIHSALGWGIRIPVLGERFLQFDTPLRFAPNPNLATEKSFSVELGVRQRLGESGSLEATAFYNRYRNLVEPIVRADYSGTLVNIPRARITGVEASGRLRFWRDRLGLEATATWTEPVITEVSEASGAPFEKGDLLSYRPRLIAYLTPSLRLGPFSLEADYGYASKLEREQMQVYKDDQRVSKKQLDARLLYRWQGLTAQVAVRNLLHYNYAQTERNLNEVRNFAVGLQIER
jgi:outer membrane receptor protein involved in Fe transport